MPAPDSDAAAMTRKGEVTRLQREWPHHAPLPRGKVRGLEKSNTVRRFANTLSVAPRTYSRAVAMILCSFLLCQARGRGRVLRAVRGRATGVRAEEIRTPARVGGGFTRGCGVPARSLPD